MIKIDIAAEGCQNGGALLLALLRMLADKNIVIAGPGTKINGPSQPRVEFISRGGRKGPWGIKAARSGGLSFRGATIESGAPMIDALWMFDSILPREIQTPTPIVYARDSESVWYAKTIRAVLANDMDPRIPVCGIYLPTPDFCDADRTSGRVLINPGALKALRMLGSRWDPEEQSFYGQSPTRVLKLRFSASYGPSCMVETYCASDESRARMRELCALYHIPPPPVTGSALFSGSQVNALALIAEDIGYELIIYPEGSAPPSDLL